MAEHQAATRDDPERLTQPLRESQDLMAKGAEWWWEATKPFIPGLGNGSFSEQLVQLVDQSFDCAGRLLEVQRDFTKAVLTMFDTAEEQVGGRTRAKRSPSA